MEQKESEMSILDVQGSPVLKSRTSKKAKSPAGPSSKVSYFKKFHFLRVILILRFTGASVLFSRRVDC